MIEHWGERCPDYEESCPCCQAWDNFDTMIAKLKSGDDIYEYKAKLLNMYDVKELKELSEQGWNVCAATYTPNGYNDLNTMFYFRRRL